MQQEHKFTNWKWGVFETDVFLVEGHNVWSFEWVHVQDNYLHQVDPLHGGFKSLALWKICPSERDIYFAAIEVSNTVWVFATRSC